MKTSNTWKNNAILILGPRKSGTTLLRSLLDGGDQVLVRPGELKVKYFPNELWESPEMAKSQYYRDKRKISAKENFDEEQYISCIQKLDESLADLKSLMLDEMNVISNSINDKPDDLKYWAAKEAGGDIDLIVRFWKQNFMNGKLIFIFRDPLMIVRSIITDAKKRGEFVTWKRIKIHLYKSIKAQMIMQKYLSKPYVTHVKYEQLTENPEKWMRAISDFLEIRYDSKLSIPTTFSIPVVVSTSSKKQKKVFKTNHKWYNGLSVREAVGFYIYKTFYLKVKFRNFDYSKI